MRTQRIAATVTLALLAACSDTRQTADLEPVSGSDLMMGSGFRDATPVAADIEVSRPAPDGAPDPRPAPTPPTAPEAAPSARVPAAAAPDQHRGGHAAHGVNAEPAPQPPLAAEDNTAGRDDAADAGPLAGEPTGGGGKPRPVADEGPIRDPNRGAVIIIRGGTGSVHDDCAIHPRMPPGILEPIMGTVPPVIAAQPAGERDALVNDRSPPGGSISGNRPPPDPIGTSHPGGRTTTTGRALPTGMRGGGPGIGRPGGIR